MAQDCASAWDRCLSIIRENINPQSFVTWFKPITPVKLENRSLTVEVPSQFFYEWLEGHYSSVINSALLQTLGENARLSYAVGTQRDGESLHLPPLDKKPGIAKPDKTSNLNGRYSFANFVEGPNNEFAKAAALAVAEAPGNTTFNPIVIYGGVGLGKTHLIQAIGNFALSEGTAKHVLYVDSEKFTIEFINSIKNHKTTEFSATYRNVDILLVDDIQFFANKERTQEEFFHTFNALYNAGKQIVLSSDRPPKEILGVEERLISRFQWGLVADIQPPDLETRTAILQQKADESGINIPGEIIAFIASRVTSNIRELEGALIRLLAFASLKGKDVNLSLAKEVLKDLHCAQNKKILIEEIQRIVSEHFNLPDDLLRAKSRKKEVAYARQVAMYLSKELTTHSLKTIGLHFGGRDHTTVIHAINTVQKLKETNQGVRDEIGVLKQKIELALN